MRDSLDGPSPTSNASFQKYFERFQAYDPSLLPEYQWCLKKWTPYLTCWVTSRTVRSALSCGIAGTLLLDRCGPVARHLLRRL